MKGKLRKKIGRFLLEKIIELKILKIFFLRDSIILWEED
jgi:hypothetical protein